MLYKFVEQEVLICAILKRYQNMSDDMVDGIAAVLLIFIIVSGVTYWLQTMP